MMRNPFSVMRAALAASVALVAQFGGDQRSALARLFAGRMLLNDVERSEFTPQQWLRDYMGIPLARPSAFGPRANTGYKRRQPTRRRGKIGYAKAIRRAVRALELSPDVVSTGPEINKRLAAYGLGMRS